MTNNGMVPEWLNGTDCKSVGSAFGGSNLPHATFFKKYLYRPYIDGKTMILKTITPPNWLNVFSAEVLYGKPRDINEIYFFNVTWCYPTYHYDTLEELQQNHFIELL